MSEWQPIETAPKGTSVLVYEPGYYSGCDVRRLAEDHTGRYVWSGGDYGDPPPAPTHWMPLPEPPAP